MGLAAKPVTLRPGSPWALFTVAATAAAVRVLYFYQQSANPFSTYPISDTAFYIARAEEILAGDLLGSAVFAQSGEPLYVYILAAIFAVFGKSLPAAQAVQHLMGVLTCAFLYLTAERLFSRQTALVLGLWAALFSPMLFHEGLLLTSAPAMLLLSAALYLFYITLETRSAKAALACGIVLGLAILCRTNLILTTPVFFLWAVIKEPKAALRTLTPYALAVGVALVVLPVTIRNYAVGGDVVLISSTGGLAFYMGNNPESIGIYNIPIAAGIPNNVTMHDAAHTIAERAAGKKLLPSEGSSYWFDRGVEYLKGSPGEAAALYWKKFYLFWNDLEFTIIYKYDFYRDYSFLLANPLLTFGPLAAFGAIGAFWMLASGTREEKTLTLLIIAYTLSVILFFVTSRLRLPVALMLFITSGFALERLRTASLRKRGAAAVAAAALILFIYQGVEGDVKKTVSSSSFTYYQVSRMYMAKSEYKRALEYLKMSLADRPESPKLLVEGGELAELAGDKAAAREMYERMVKGSGVLKGGAFTVSSPYDMALYKALVNLGVINYRDGRLREAAELLRTAVEGYPQGTRAVEYLAMTHDVMRTEAGSVGGGR